MRKMMDMAWFVIKIGAAVYIGLCLLLFAFQTRYVYFPDRDVAYTPRDVGLPFESITLETPDGASLAGWFVPAPQGTLRPRTLLFCHGNAGDIGDRVGSVRTFHDLGLNVFIFDYRGYGASTGKPTEHGTYTDARTAWRYLVDDRGIPPETILVFGRSLGGAIASRLALDVTPPALVLESAFTSAGDMGQRMFPFLPVRLLARYRYDSLSRMPKLRCPVLIAHSPEDETVPYALGKRLYEHAVEPKVFITFHGSHNDGGMDASPAYRDAFRRWLQDLDKPAATPRDPRT